MPTFIRELVEKYGKRRSLILALVGAGAIVAVLGFSHWATRPVWAPLVQRMPLEMTGEVTDALDEAGIEYRMEMGGTRLDVQEKDLARARVLLAQEGLPSRSRPGFELFDQPSWGMTDFTQRVNYRRALEGELERTISQMRGVESAQVHLSLQETSIFRRDDRQSEASVFLRLRSSARPSSELVEGITFLVASSVEGLTSRNVTVLDDAGRVLSAAVEPGTPDALSKRQLALRRDIEAYLEERAEGLVADLVGAGNVRIRISAALNFDRIDRTVQSLDPDLQVVTREERSEIIPGENTVGAGSRVESLSYETPRSIETFSGAIGDIKRLTVAVLVNDRVVGDGEGVQLEPRGPEELARIETLVRNAVGLDPARGDDISVVSLPFDGTGVPRFDRDRPSVWTWIVTMQRPLVGALALILIFILTMQVLRQLRGRWEPVALEPLPVGIGPGELEDDEYAEALTGEVEEETRDPEVDDSIAQTILERPENAVRVVRAWLRDA